MVCSLEQTIVALFHDRVRSDGERVAVHARRGGEMRAHTWNDLARDVRRFAAALASLGVERGDRVLLVSPNRYEWLVTDLGIQTAGAVHVPVHASLSGAQIAFQIADSGAKVIVVSSAEQAEKLAPHAAALPAGTRLVTFDAGVQSWPGHDFLRFEELLATSRDDFAPASIAPGDLATILYTSGTTGEPKGVMLSQNNLASNAISATSAFGPRAGDVRLNWLPLSHIFARTCDFYTWLVQGCELVLADSPETAVPQCAEFHPTLVNGVPYFFERVMRLLQQSPAADRPGALAEIFGGRLRAGIAGGAALPAHVGEFYERNGVTLLEGYGLTETSPVISTCTTTANKRGTVGPPIAGVEVRIADDGEILTRGPHVMLGYWHRPADTAEILRDGWLYTGDLGEIDADGFLKITGRKKELIVTAGGKNISPIALESLLAAEPLIHQAVVIGDGRNYLTALIVPDPATLRAAIIERRIPVTNAAEALASDEVRKLYAKRIRERMAGVSRYEQIGDFILLDRAFTVESGDLTPTLKLRRSAIARKYADKIEAMYAKKADA
ncbi:MAG TPA: AMP-dependent synthetase/ligase [Pirellulales bacterium]|jgi:long-chain acyl-CoA synthetase|nr:AMP-dependent synthetase/ligase [Pirellulales bacterium]